MLGSSCGTGPGGHTGMCLFGTGPWPIADDDWVALMLSSVMVVVSEPISADGRCGAMGRGRAIVAIMTGDRVLV